MTWALVREQLRAQRRFVVATGVVLALAITAAAYGMFMATTTGAGASKADAAFGIDKEWHVTSIVAGADSPAVESGDVQGPYAPLETQNAALEQAIAEGSDVVAVRDFNIAWSELSIATPVAMGGAVDWDTILAHGSAPDAGEVVLESSAARDAGVDVGDTWEATVSSCGESECADVPLSFRVSGIAKSGFDTAGLRMDLPGAYFAWEDSASIIAAVNPPTSGNFAPPFTHFSWTAGSTALDSLGPADTYTSSGSVNSRNATGVSFAVLGALVIGLIAMAFAVGRAQAQSRSKWVATARTLGASKRQILTTNLIEAGAVGLVAALVGIVAGFGLASIHVGIVQRSVPDAAYPTHVVLAAWVIAALLVLALVLSGIVAAVPAFWATRVSPVAALKPVSDISEAEVSRRVSAKPLVIAWVVANAIAVTVVATGPADLTVLFGVLAGIVVLVTTPMLMHEALRWATPRVGGRLSRSPRRALMIAGDALLARPRQATIPAFIVALGVGTVLTVLVPTAAQTASERYYVWSDATGPQVAWLHAPELPSWTVLLAIAATLITTVLTLAIGAATATLTAREAATREALGATRADSRGAGAIAYGVMQGLGIVLGLLVGLFASAWIVSSMFSDLSVANRMAALSCATLPVLGALLIAATGGAIGAALTASFTPQPVTTSRLESVA